MTRILILIALILGLYGYQLQAQNGIQLLLEGENDATLSNGTGLLQIGNSAGRNLVFDRNEILARIDGENSPLFLNIEGGLVKTGQEDKPANFWATGYTRLGNDASHPWIRIKKIVDVNNSGEAVTNLPHTLPDASKILAIHIISPSVFSGTTVYNHLDIESHDEMLVNLKAPINNGRAYIMYITYEL